MPKVSASAPAPVAAAAAPAAVPAKRRRTEPSPAPAAAAAPAPVEPVADAEAPAPASYEALLAQADALRTQAGALVKALREFHIANNRALKAAAGAKKTKKPRDPNAPPRKPSGITMPMTVSKDLLKFMKLADGTQVSRVTASKAIREYATKANLALKDSKGKFAPDATLQKLLGVKADDVLTVPLIAKTIGVHFPAKAVAAPKA